MNQYRVEYYVKPALSSRITKLGGSWGEKTEQQIITEITLGLAQYYVSNIFRKAMIVVERSAPGSPYLKTVPDNTKLDNLLMLPRRYF